MDVLGIFGCVLFIELYVSVQGNDTDRSSSKDITRCVTKRRENVTLMCPKDQVMFDAKFMYGVSRKKKRCLMKRNDCLGSTSLSIRQLSDCFWRNSCTLTLQKNLPLSGSVLDPRYRDQNESCIGKIPNYVVLNNPRCSLQNEILDMCTSSGETLITSNIRGLIRSDPNYPWGYLRQNTSCAIRFSYDTSVTLMLNVESFDIENGDVLTFLWRTEGNVHRAFVNNENRTFIVQGDLFNLIWETGEGLTSRRGFTTSFQVLNYLQHGMPLMNDANTVVGYKGDFFKTATMQTDMGWSSHKMTFSCPTGSVVYSPDLFVGVGREMECKGLTTGLLVDKYNCYWKTSCSMKWYGPAVVSLSRDNTCVGRSVNTLTTQGFNCMRKDHIVNICDEGSKELESTSGILLSHSNFPWNYASQAIKCRKTIQIGTGRQLYVQIETVDVYERDTFILRHMLQSNRLLTRLTKNVQNVNYTFSGGFLDVTLTTTPQTMAGKGFLIYYKLIDAGARNVMNTQSKRDRSGLESNKLDSRRKTNKRKRKRQNTKRKNGKRKSKRRRRCKRDRKKKRRCKRYRKRKGQKSRKKNLRKKNRRKIRTL